MISLQNFWTIQEDGWFFLQFLEKNSPIRIILVHMNNALLKIRLPASNVNQLSVKLIYACNPPKKHIASVRSGCIILPATVPWYPSPGVPRDSWYHYVKWLSIENQQCFFIVYSLSTSKWIHIGVYSCHVWYFLAI